MSRIALYLPDLNAGGAEQVMLKLAGSFSSCGHRVDIVLARAEGMLLDSIPDGVNMVDLKAGRFLPGRLGFGIEAAGMLSKYLRNVRPKVLLSTLTGANLTAILAVRLSLASETRLVLREASSIVNLRNSMYRFLLKKTYPWADHIITVSQQIGAELVGVYGLSPESISPIPNPIDIERIRTQGMEVPNHPWYVLHELPVIISAGRLTPAKDFETLIRAFAIVRERINARLLILGEGPLRKDLQTLITRLGLEEDIELPGFVMNPYPFIKHSELFVLSSRWEGFPNVLLEALALQTEVVATDCPTGPKELLASGTYGHLVAPGDYESLAVKIQDVLQGNSSPSQSLINRAMQYRLDNITAQYLERLLVEGE